jgi:hypothetical protein
MLQWKILNLLPKGFWFTVLQFEQYVSCVTITDLRSLAYKFAELNHFSHTPNKGTYRLKEMVLDS